MSGSGSRHQVDKIPVADSVQAESLLKVKIVPHEARILESKPLLLLGFREDRLSKISERNNFFKSSKVGQI